MTTLSWKRPLHLAWAFAVLSTPALATTYVVDDNGGPGVDFTTISAAVAAAQPGDLILVLDGTYSGFTLTKGLTVMGSGVVTVQGAIEIANVPAGIRAQVLVRSSARRSSTCPTRRRCR
jgi:hypothetical protein